MTRAAKLGLAVLLLAGVAGALGCSGEDQQERVSETASPTGAVASIVGRYIDPDANGYIDLNSDGSFYLVYGRTERSGEWRVAGRTIRLISPSGSGQTAVLRGDGTIELYGTVFGDRLRPAPASMVYPASPERVVEAFWLAINDDWALKAGEYCSPSWPAYLETNYPHNGLRQLMGGTFGSWIPGFDSIEIVGVETQNNTAKVRYRLWWGQDGHGNVMSLVREGGVWRIDGWGEWE